MDTEKRCSTAYIHEGNIMRTQCFFESNFGIAVRMTKSVFLENGKAFTSDYFLGFYAENEPALTAVNQEMVSLHFADGSSYEAAGCNDDNSVCSLVRERGFIPDNPDVDSYNIYGGIGMKESKSGLLHRLGKKRIIAVSIQGVKHPIDNETGEKIRTDFLKLTTTP
ncbi:hypothetical protein [Chlorobium sp. N1]|uniref:hypothetical protein n=1 Tax=Chlorobium sp. N1 TaxID=2491138 RepID=UPI001038CB3E|nr:hypothetical protein [Chlorobium sp. N1]TCD48608.1 hypothetical protein E0L29_01645 [Chlorobium sp. N1]